MIRLVLLLALTGLACRIAPVITEPTRGGGGGDRYHDCKRAAEDYCEYVLEASDEGMKKCVSEAVFDCITGNPR